MATSQRSLPTKVPRVAITYCTQCRWMLRAAYFGQELLSTFNTSIGEVALIPATGGVFTVSLSYLDSASELKSEEVEVKEVLIWDRKAEGGFPEAKILKQRIRNHIDPDRSLGHSDTPSTKTSDKVMTDNRTAEALDKSVPSEPQAGVQKQDQACTDCA